MFRFDVVPAGDSALHVQLPERIDPLENAWCIRLARSIEQHLGSAVRDVVVGYCSVTAYFEPLLTDPAWLEARIREFLAGIVPAHADSLRHLPADAPLWELVGSLNLLELADYLEAAFTIRIEPLHFIPENFRSVGSLARMVRAHLGAPLDSPDRL